MISTVKSWHSQPKLRNIQITYIAKKTLPQIAYFKRYQTEEYMLAHQMFLYKYLERNSKQDFQMYIWTWVFWCDVQLQQKTMWHD